MCGVADPLTSSSATCSTTAPISVIGRNKNTIAGCEMGTGMIPRHSNSNSESNRELLLSSLCGALDDVCRHNTLILNRRATKDSVTRFHASADPNLSVKNYVARLLKYSGASPSAYVAALVLMNRIVKRLDNFLLSYFSVHRLLVTSLLLATKFLDDQFYSNRHWSRVAGVSLRELNCLEAEALRLIEWKVMVHVEEFDDVVEALLQDGRHHLEQKVSLLSPHSPPPCSVDSTTTTTTTTTTTSASTSTTTIALSSPYQTTNSNNLQEESRRIIKQQYTVANSSSSSSSSSIYHHHHHHHHSHHQQQFNHLYPQRQQQHHQIL